MKQQCCIEMQTVSLLEDEEKKTPLRSPHPPPTLVLLQNVPLDSGWDLRCMESRVFERSRRRMCDVGVSCLNPAGERKSDKHEDAA